MGDRRETRGVNNRVRSRVQPNREETNAEIMRLIDEIEKINAKLKLPESEMTSDDVELEDSPLSGDVTRDGTTFRVQIYRIKDSGEGWSLEVVDQSGGSTVWQDTFDTPQDAYREFYKTLEEEGPQAFLQNDLRASKLN
jgi:hypothetical protein